MIPQKIEASVSMTIDDKGNKTFRFVGPPLHLDTFWYGMLESAKDSVRAEAARKLTEKVKVPEFGEVAAFGMSRKS